jgi:hypothetical protein
MFNRLCNHLFYLSTLHVSTTMGHLQVFSVVFSYTLLTIELQSVLGVTWSAQRIPTAVNFGFLDRSRYFFFQVAPQL